MQRLPQRRGEGRGVAPGQGLRPGRARGAREPRRGRSGGRAKGGGTGADAEGRLRLRLERQRPALVRLLTVGSLRAWKPACVAVRELAS